MTNDTDIKKDNTETVSTDTAEASPQSTAITAEAKATQSTDHDGSSNIQALQEKVEALTKQFAEKEKSEKQKAQQDQVKKLEAQILEMSKKLEEQADMTSSTRVDGGSMPSGNPIQTEINLNFRSSDVASWEKAAQQFLKNFQANS